MSHAEIEELLGAYALDAVDAQEALVVEEHLVTCPRCRAEVAAHREVATMLGNAGGEAPEGLWDRIAAELDAEPAERPHAPTLDRELAGNLGLVEGASRDDLAAERQRRRPVRAVPWALGAVAAALAIVAGVLTAKVATLDHQVRTVTSALEANGTSQQAALAATDPRHRSYALTSTAGTSPAVLVTLPSGRAYWITRGKLAALPPDKTYQLWALADGRVVSIGLLGRAPNDVPIEVTANMTKFMVTAEPLGGTSRPTTPIVVQSGIA